MSADDTDPTTAVLAVRDCWELLRSTTVGRLAVLIGGGPDIFPVNYVVDHGSVVFRTGAGSKLAGAKGRDVAFEVDGYDVSHGAAWSVVVKGECTAILDTPEAISAMTLPLVPWEAGNKPWLLRVVPGSVTGRRIHVLGGVGTDPS